MEVLDLYSLRFQDWVYRKLIWYDGGQAILPEPADVTRVLDYLKSSSTLFKKSCIYVLQETIILTIYIMI
jgi:hypothetical protein